MRALVLLFCLWYVSFIYAGDPRNGPCRALALQCIDDLTAGGMFLKCEPYVRCHYNVNDPRLIQCVHDALRCERAMPSFIPMLRYTCSLNAFNCMEATH